PRMPPAHLRHCLLDASLTRDDGAGRAVLQPVHVGNEDARVLISRRAGLDRVAGAGPDAPNSMAWRSRPSDTTIAASVKTVSAVMAIALAYENCAAKTASMYATVPA